MFFDSFPNIFDSDLPEFFNYIASEEKKNIDYKLLSTQIFLPSGKSFNFLYKYNELYNFWFNLLFKNLNLADVKSQQIEFLKDLMDGFNVYKKIKKPKNELN